MAMFFANVPVWVWPLLLLLIAIGVMSMRRRSARLMVVYALPLMAIMPLRSVSSLSPPADMWAVIWAIFALGYLLGALAGYWMQGRWIEGKSVTHIHLRGEAVTLGVLMVIFALNFVHGSMTALSPEVVATLGFSGLFALVAAVAGGSFLGRAARIWRFPVGAQRA